MTTSKTAIWIIMLWATIVVDASAQQSTAPYTFEWDVVAVDGIPGMTTARLYAKLVNPTDYLTSVSGWDDMVGWIETTTSFYQDSAGWVTPNNNNPLLFDLLPTLRYDTWVTIGIESAPEGAVGEIPVGVFPPENGFWVEEFEQGGDLVMDIDGAWFVTMGSSNGTAGEDLRVLVGQFTTDGVISGVLNLQVFSEGVASSDFMEDVFAITIPEFDAGNALITDRLDGPSNWVIRLENGGAHHELGGPCHWECLDLVGRRLDVGVSGEGRFVTQTGCLVKVWREGERTPDSRWVPGFQSVAN